ncbi:hypothetical protein EFD55_07980 [Rhizobium pisi]|uniref:Uncharacterized protein n=1 Tax=Rhizobium pisi TaxID=574561 RepID=A0A3R9AJ49_9HYPH|nr:hypothetical protein EFD55_07980 [Rhizobium pisi]
MPWKENKLQILDFETSGGFAGDSARVLARFSVQVTDDIRLCNLRLVDTPKGRRTFFPGVSGRKVRHDVDVAFSPDHRSSIRIFRGARDRR